MGFSFLFGAAGEEKESDNSGDVQEPWILDRKGGTIPL